ncbi:polysaccharide lyase family 8 super-sandwich domain protein [Bacteroides sp. CAG:633]|nr:polysaccharide lyase family 8 super-sandwich domain protein [Bacteroides sp. CAG:633]
MAFSDEQLEILRQLIDKGYRWILWKGQMDISALGRQFFREGQTHKGLSTAFAATELGGGMSESCNSTARALCNENFQLHSRNDLIGNKHFFCSNYTVHRRPTWMATVKMASNKVIGTETLNGDNMKGFYSADGATYVYTDGHEYLDIFPLWDWRKLPGVTAFESDAPIPVVKGNRPRNNADFVGGLSDGQQGMTVMDLNRAGLQGRKAWIFTDNYILCLGAGIEADSTLAVTTAIEQCYKRDNLYFLSPDGNWQVLTGSDTQNQTSEVRYFHHHTGYIAWNEKLNVTATTEKRTGQWHDIMQMYPRENVSGEVIQLCLNHGTAPKNASYQYLILPDSDRRQTALFDRHSIRVLHNDRSLQAVVLENGTCWMATSRPATLKLPDKTIVEVLTPGIYKIAPSKNGNYTALWTSPSRQHPQAELHIGKKQLILTDTY